MVSGEEWNLEHIQFGVPQSLILVPILFHVYFNDIVKILAAPNAISYADDTNTFFTHGNLRHIDTAHNTWLAQPKLWLEINGITLNINKTKYIIVCREKKPLNYDLAISVQSDCLERFLHHKCLGVFSHEHLNSPLRVSRILCDVSKVVGVWNKLRLLLPSWLKRELYYDLIDSKLQ